MKKFLKVFFLCFFLSSCSKDYLFVQDTKGQVLSSLSFKDLKKIFNILILSDISQIEKQIKKSKPKKILLYPTLARIACKIKNKYKIDVILLKENFSNKCGVKGIQVSYDDAISQLKNILDKKTVISINYNDKYLRQLEKSPAKIISEKTTDEQVLSIIDSVKDFDTLILLNKKANSDILKRLFNQSNLKIKLVTLNAGLFAYKIDNVIYDIGYDAEDIFYYLKTGKPIKAKLKKIRDKKENKDLDKDKKKS